QLKKEVMNHKEVITPNVKEDLKPQRRKRRIERKQKMEKSNFEKPEVSRKLKKKKNICVRKIRYGEREKPKQE
ncbi:2206_t:CDS:1, partial [Acaulospora morrowiae]